MLQWARVAEIVICIGSSGPLLLAAFSSENTAAAVILNSGSSNFSGCRIVVERSGHAEYTPTSRRYTPQGQPPASQQRRIPEALVRRLYANLEAAMPLSSLPAQHCMKSASFGSTLIIEWSDSRTPDLNCGDGGDPKMRALIRSAKEIEALFR